MANDRLFVCLFDIPDQHKIWIKTFKIWLQSVNNIQVRFAQPLNQISNGQR